MASKGDLEEVVVSMSKVSIEVEVKEEKGKKIDRHCAFCLTLVPGAEVKLCSKCKRRAYCSKECQVADWKRPQEKPAFNGKIHGYGQGHKDWCGLEVGEEDLDWKVAPISGKGLGLVALRDLPPLYKILVEGMQLLKIGEDNLPLPYHPALNDLTPLDASILTKFRKNGFEKNVPRVGLRHSRVNHNCRNNASITNEPRKTNVLILFSDVEIKAGEEICTSYFRGYVENSIASGIPALVFHGPEECRESLLKNWGIVCPPSCSCLDPRTRKLLEKTKALGKFCEENFMEKQVNKMMEEVIENAKELRANAFALLGMYALAIKYAEEGREKNWWLAKAYFEMSMQIWSAMYHPKTAEEMKKMKNSYFNM